MEFKADVMDADALRRCLIRMSHQILERNGGTDNLCLVGIKRRGVPIARMIRDNILNIEGADVPVGTLDITLYRDDLSELGSFPKISESDLPFDVTGKTIVLVDDVMFTGRSCRAAIDALMNRGRPKNIQLAVLVDRGHRELPLRPDYVGKNVPTSREEKVKVMVKELDGCDMAVILE